MIVDNGQKGELGEAVMNEMVQDHGGSRESETDDDSRKQEVNFENTTDELKDEINICQNTVRLYYFTSTVISRH